MPSPEPEYRLVRRYTDSRGDETDIFTVYDQVNDDPAHIEVTHCIVCGDRKLAALFAHHQQLQRRVAVASRVGVCATCHSLFAAKRHDELIARRLCKESWDFTSQDLVQLIEDLADDLRKSGYL